MINLHESMAPGRDRTRDPWICSQTRICCQTRCRLRYAARFKLEYAAPIWSSYCKTQQVEKVQRTAAHWTCRRWRNTSSVSEMLDELQWTNSGDLGDQFSPLSFHKIHCGAMPIDKDKYFVPSQRTRSTR